MHHLPTVESPRFLQNGGELVRVPSALTIILRATRGAPHALAGQDSFAQVALSALIGGFWRFFCQVSWSEST